MAARPPLAPILGPDGQPLAWASPGPDGQPLPLLAEALAAILARDAAAEAHAQAIRQGLCAPPPAPSARWLISDRH